MVRVRQVASGRAQIGSKAQAPEQKTAEPPPVVPQTGVTSGDSGMGRPIYPQEMGDPDFFWLISSFRENHPDYSLIEIGSLPMVLIREGKQTPPEEVLPVPELQQAETDEVRKEK